MNRASCEHIDEYTLIVSAQNGDRESLQMLIERYRMLITSLASRLRCQNVSREELIQAGFLGFMQALIHYDQRHNAQLSTYAYPWILGEMRRTLRLMEIEGFSLEESLGEDGQKLIDTIKGSGGVDTDRIALHLAMQRMDKEEQILICLRYFRDQTQKETALLMGKSQAQISKMERRVLDRLHAMLTE